MANFERSGLYVVIKNVEQLKKTFATINALKGGKEITMHFETITVNKETNEKINVLKIYTRKQKPMEKQIFPNL